jgi:predicted permease
MLLTIAGGVLGLLAGWWSLDWLTSLGLSDLPRAHEIRLDGVVIAFVLGLAVLLGVVIGAVPAIQLAGTNLNSALRDEGRTGSAGRGTRRVRRMLVVAQVGLAFVLLVGAGLLLASFRMLQRVDPGFRAENVATGRVSPLQSRYPNDSALRSYATRTLERIRALPGVTAAGITSFLPFSWDDSSTVIIPEGYAPSPGESVVSPSQLYVTPGYMEALGVQLKRGRFFSDSDGAGAPGVVIVDERLANKFWPNADPIGRRMYQPQSVDDVVKPGPKVTWLQVVGVVGTVKLKGLIEGEGARVGAFYMPLAQQMRRDMAFAVRTVNDPASITGTLQRAVAEIDPDTALYDIFTMTSRVEKSLNPRRTPMLLSIAFGGVALLLAAIGIYGVLAYQVAQRTREFGIRIALGSDTRRILGLVLREGLLLVGVGLGAGIVGAVLLRQLIVSQLYGVGAFDPVVLGGVTVVLAFASLLACLGPARRATRVDPVIALGQQ